MADLALVRECLDKALKATTMNNARYFISLAMSHLPPALDPNIQHPATAGALGGPFPEEDP